MILILRNQQRIPYYNVLNSKGLETSFKIATAIANFSCSKKTKIHSCIYTSYNSLHNNRCESLQTASNIATKLDKYVSFTDLENTFINDHENQCIVCVFTIDEIHHILNTYYPKVNFKWNDSNYVGCLVLLNESSWYFEPNFSKCYKQTKNNGLVFCLF